MSEEDIIEEIEEWLQHDTNFENLPEYDAKNLFITVQGLLDLYKQEKEKNKQMWIEGTKVADKLWQSRLKEELKQEKEKNEKLQNENINLHDAKKLAENGMIIGNINVVGNYISKDKIRERIKQLKQEKEDNPDFATIQAIILDYEMLLEG